MVDTLVVGVDAGCWSRVTSLLERDELPNLASMERTGVSGTLRSTSPPMTPPAWTSMATGVGPECHGVQDFLAMNPETYRIAPLGVVELEVPAIWDVFAAEDRRIGILNLPMIYPPPSVEGCFLSGIPHEVEDGIAYPEWLQDILDETEYTVHPREGPDDSEVYLAELERLVQTRTEVALRVLEKRDIELLWTVYMATDWVQHYLWSSEIDGENAVDRIYRLVDRQIGRLCDAVGDDCNVLVASDHGATPIEHEIHLNTLLEAWGFLKRTELGTLVKAKSEALSRAIDLATRLPESVKRRLRHVVTSDRHARIREAAGRGQLGLHEKIVWEDTEAFSFGYMGQIYMNRSDWYARGVVSPNEYLDVRAELVSQFEELVHPSTGEILIESASTADELYSEVGPRIPDVVLEPRDWNAMMYGDFAEDWIGPVQNRVADHAPEGIFLASGPAIAEGEIDIDAVDLTPTLLHLHGLPIPDVATGEVRTEVFDGDFINNNEVKRERMTVGAKSAQVEERNDEIESRLEDLGYL